MKSDALKKIYKQNTWYVQGLNARPIYLNGAAWSGMKMKPLAGFGYKHLMGLYKNDFAEIQYDEADLNRLWGIIYANMQKDPEYLSKMRHLYLEYGEKKHHEIKEKFSQPLSEYSDSEMLVIFKMCLDFMWEVVSVAHMIEPISISGEKLLRAKLSDELSQPDFEKHFEKLFSAQEKSFVAREENELLRIKKMSGEEQKKALKKHFEKYYWIENSYVRAKRLTIADFEKRMQELQEIDNFQAHNESVEEIFQELHISEDLRQLVEAMNFATLWQDERKEYILQSIGYLSEVILHIAERISLDAKNIEYLDCNEIYDCDDLFELQSIAKHTDIRFNGSVYYIQEKRVDVFTGDDYKSILGQENLEYKNQKDIYGSPASLGIVRGRVRVCMDLKSIEEVLDGEILVTSMTRPEYFVAMKKAAGIITDEGGLTSHAAIVSRELGIPCVIGTKNATKILQTGDLVEIRAHHGLVKILKKVQE